ncbi:MAG: LysR family transcriptional regulator [Rhodoferax sp.]|nr:LysR family transcriptional regulator [Rhodoferax sp.]
MASSKLRVLLVRPDYWRSTACAAEDLQIGQPVLSHAMRALELELGVALFGRRPRTAGVSFRVTPDKTAALQRVQRAADNHP